MYQSIEPNTNPNLLLQPASYYGEKYRMNLKATKSKKTFKLSIFINTSLLINFI